MFGKLQVKKEATSAIDKLFFTIKIILYFLFVYL